jgi:hypothetical protein
MTRLLHLDLQLRQYGTSVTAVAGQQQLFWNSFGVAIIIILLIKDFADIAVLLRVACFLNKSKIANATTACTNLCCTFI